MSAMPQSKFFVYQDLCDGVLAAIATNDGGAMSNSAIVDLGHKTLIFDSTAIPQAVPDLIEAARFFTGRPSIDYVVNSHFHFDHIRGNAVFDPATTIIGSQALYDAIQTQGAVQLQQSREQGAQQLAGLETFFAEKQGELNELERLDIEFTLGWMRAMQTTLSDVTLRPPDLYFPDTLTLEGSQRQVQLLSFAYAHSPADLVLYLPQEHAALVGDIVSVQRQPSLFESRLPNLFNALDNLESLGLQNLMAGHGPVGSAQDISSIRHYVQTMDGVVQTQVAQGASLDDVLQLPEAAPFNTWRFGVIMHELNLRCLYELHTNEKDIRE